MMEKMDNEIHGRTGMVIVILVVVGIIVLGAGGYLAWSKRRGGGATAAVSDEVTRWCSLRQDWARQADPLAGDIMLKSVKDEDRAAMEQLVAKRGKLAAEFGRRIDELRIQDPAIAAVEAALIKEGKVRANTAVEIHNTLAKIDESEDTTALTKLRDELKVALDARIKQNQQNADREVAAALTAVGSTCPKLYRGPATDAGTSDSPYTTWDELEMRRARAVAQFEAKLKKLEPVEEFTNRVYHEIVRQYRGLLTSCYQKAKAKNPSIASTVGLRIRLKKSGEVKTLAIEWMDPREDRLLDCLLEKASKWKLPRPDPTTEVVVVTLDFAKI